MTLTRTLTTGMMTAMLSIAATSLHAETAPRLWRLDGPAKAGEQAIAPTAPWNPATGGYESDGALSLPVAEGNWLVTLDIGSDAHAGTTTIKAENRRLMLDRIASAKGQHVVRRFVVHVHNASLGAVPLNAPGGDHVRLTPAQAAQRNWDDRLTLEVLGPGATVRWVKVEPTQVPTIFTVGDSMVADHPTEPTGSWAQFLPAMLDDGIAVANYAESGATLKSFLADLRLDKALSLMKPGDVLMIQFGHNDQKANWPQTYAEANTTYRAYLAAYIAEARRRGATPVLVTSPERRNFDAAGHIVPSLGDYPKVMRDISQEQNVPLVDLNRASIALYEALGPERAPAMFNDEGRDKTHYDNWGAWMAARIVADQLRIALPALASHITSAPFDPARPEKAEIAVSAAHSSQRPLGN
ncbi:rhamnogalacturonan acetylesterase [Novosphingobium terrae]|uniref:rhamnogalacturonan acetylesterase n=1 Tax=Novosphingobium terrae TaxID=2726189 RepID=UPI00197DA88F|nr:rhamnogalacturonan acetylesterase [Novosphingobium terrae]